jgi:hypothetical protein
MLTLKRKTGIGHPHFSRTGFATKTVGACTTLGMRLSRPVKLMAAAQPDAARKPRVERGKEGR